MVKMSKEAEQAAWLALAIQHQDLLVDFVAGYHPAASRRAYIDMKITAWAAQAACVDVCAELRRTATVEPVAQLQAAIAARDINQIYTVLNSTWFGVPESRSCWEIPGFQEAVELLESVPEL